MPAESRDHPLVTMALLTYNAAEKLAASLASLQAQDYPNLEILIQDDVSKDNTVEICRSYLADPRIRLNVNEKNLGAWGNFALAAENARGEFLCWACPGDWWEPNFVSAVMRRLHEVPGAIGGQTDVVRIDERTRTPIEVQVMSGRRPPDTLSRLDCARRTLIKVRQGEEGPRYSQYLHGVIRTAAVRETLRAFPQPLDILNERVVVCHWAAAGPLVTVPSPLIRREKHAETQSVRAPNDPTLKGRNDPHRFLRRLWHQSSQSVRHSRLLAGHQKLIVRVAVASYITRLIRLKAVTALVAVLRQLLSSGVYSTLRRWYRRA